MSKIQDLIKNYSKNKTSENLREIVKEIQMCSVMYSAYSPITRNHYIDYVQGVPCAFLFSEKKYAEGFCRHIKKSGNTVGIAECKKNDRLAMLADYHRSGIEGILVDNGQAHIMIELTELINTPDFSEIPENERPVMNPSLVCSGNRLFQCVENHTITPDKELNLLVDTFKSKYLIPVQGGIDNETNTVTIPALERGDGKKVVPFFSDLSELRKFDETGKYKIATAQFAQIEEFCNNGETVVINPFGFNFTLTKDTCEAIQNAAKTVPHNTAQRAVIFTPDDVPESLTENFSRLFDDDGRIVRGYIRGLRKGGSANLLVVIDCEDADAETAKQIVDEISEQAKEFTNEKLEYISTAVNLGKIAAKDAIPFFEKFTVDVSVPPDNFEIE